MQKKVNADIYKAMRIAGVYHWQVFKALGMGSATFYVKLREELPAEEKARWLSVINELSEAQETPPSE